MAWLAFEAILRFAMIVRGLEGTFNHVVETFSEILSKTHADTAEKVELSFSLSFFLAHPSRSRYPTPRDHRLTEGNSSFRIAKKHCVVEKHRILACSFLDLH